MNSLVSAHILLRLKMDNNRFELALVDGSFLLKRSAAMVCKNKKPEEMNPGDVLRLMTQTLRKAARDYGITAGKYIIIWDLWKPEWNGYYRTQLIKDYVNYKGTRVYYTEEKLEEMRRDPTVSKKKLETAEFDLACHKVRDAAKRAWLENGHLLGILNYGFPGYEADDIITITAFELYGKQQKPNIIISKDTDLHYSLTPGTSFYRLNSNYTDVITYNDVWAKVPDKIKERGLGLYQYKAYLESLSVTHNDMVRTLKYGIKVDDAIIRILDGDYSVLENREAFEAQMSTFNLWSLPDIETVRRDVNTFLSAGYLPSPGSFHQFCRLYGVTGISESYFSGFCEQFDQKLFSA